MDRLKPLSDFLSLVAQDGRIGPTHIAVYVALWKIRLDRGFENPIRIFSRDVMYVAKISWRNTFYSCVHDLHEYGYISYAPSFKRTQGSLIFFSGDKEPM
ncbi:hypothetical protein GR160_08020 [Flavobacterium sp. Sd200]|uniref:hypothetical protein n=1 Tax=Flavobacterium sp. Sd200 TaxID=2692211 RepID=UPI00136C5EE3|nr:hypothetical protein [Flavobacterium sp. Sd200]MXN91175.1 hypothetical protein [Flavobacterium sp. Sd200]